MMNNWKRAGSAAVAFLVAALVGCGGSFEGAEPPSATVLRVEGRSMSEPGAALPSMVKSRETVWVTTTSRVMLGPLEASKSLVSTEGGRQLVGVGRDIGVTSTSDQTLQHLRWNRTPAGGQVAAVSFTAQDAKGLRLGVQIDALPGAAKLRIYSQERNSIVFQITGEELLQRIQGNVNAGDSSKEARTWWTPDLGSEEVTLEVELPVNADTSALKISVPRLSHIFSELNLLGEPEGQAKINESADCHLDATCDDTYANQRNAVARMLFNNGGRTYLCTGTLLNDSKNSGIPYFLSASHCISNQTVASTIQTDWFYRSPSCNSRSLSSASSKLYNGAVLLSASNSTDVSLMRLNDAPPAGAFFAGWDASLGESATGAAVAGLHHPRGDLLKISKGRVLGQIGCTTTGDTQFSCSGTSGNFQRVAWSQGSTEGGSSGSALFSGDRRHVIGTLYGGAASCTAMGTSFDVYGRFDVAYNENLSQWLGGSASDSNTSRALESILKILRVSSMN